MDWNGMAAFVAAIGVILQIWLSYRRDIRMGTKVDNVADEVRTGNNLTLGQASDATESRRVENIPVRKRTAAEKAHLKTVPPKPKG